MIQPKDKVLEHLNTLFVSFCLIWSPWVSHLYLFPDIDLGSLPEMVPSQSFFLQNANFIWDINL